MTDRRIRYLDTTNGYRPEANKIAPGTAACSKAWTQIMKIAVDHALILQAYGGVATIALPVDQRKANVRDHVLKTDLWAGGVVDDGRVTDDN